jgi:hypothetical protein
MEKESIFALLNSPPLKGRGWGGVCNLSHQLHPLHSLNKNVHNLTDTVSMCGNNYVNYGNFCPFPEAKKVKPI